MLHKVKCYLKAGGIRLSDSIISNLSAPRAFFITVGCFDFARTSIGITSSVFSNATVKMAQAVNNTTNKKPDMPTAVHTHIYQ